MRLKLLLIVMTLLIAGGCATYRNNSLEIMKTLPQHYEQFDMQMGWKITSGPDSTVISGVVKNIRYFEMDQLEIWIASLDAKGKEVHRGVDYVETLRNGDADSFSIKLPALASGSRLRFTYNYLGLDGGDPKGAIGWTQSFETEVP